MAEGYHFERQPISPEESKEKSEETSKENLEEKGRIEEIQPDFGKEAQKFDQEFAEAVEKQIKSGELNPEQAEKILKQLEVLSPEERAELLKELEKEGKISSEKTTEGTKEKETKETKETNETNEIQESISKYEVAIDDLVQRAKDLGVEISPEKLQDYLEKLANIEPESEEKMDWLDYFDEKFQKLETQIQSLEKMKQEGKLTPEKRKAAKEDLTKTFEELTAKVVEYVLKLTARIAKGIIKGVIRAFRKEQKV